MLKLGRGEGLKQLASWVSHNLSGKTKRTAKEMKM